MGNLSEIPAGLLVGFFGSRKTALNPRTRSSSTPNSRLVIIRNQFLRGGRTLYLFRANVQQFPKKQHRRDRKWEGEITRDHVVRTACQILSEKPRHDHDRDESAGISDDREEDGSGKNRELLPKLVLCEMSVNRRKHGDRHE